MHRTHAACRKQREDRSTEFEYVDAASGGGFEGSNPQLHDSDGDNDVDMADFRDFQRCWDKMLSECLPVHNTDGDSRIDDEDWLSFQQCFSDPGESPGPNCPAPSGFEPAFGDFALHGRPIDVLPDGKILYYVRARTYDPEHGRWLQRDPAGYVDGGNLYEAFGSNAMARTDPFGLWIARRIAEIVAQTGQLTIGDIQRLGEELNSSVRNQLYDLTDDEVALLAAIGGSEYGEPFQAATLSEDLRKDADKRWSGIASPELRYRAEANYRTRRRILWILALQNQAFSQYVTDLYRVSRDVNPIHFTAERLAQMASGTETVTGQNVSRIRAGAELIVYLAILKTARVLPGAITRAAGGEVPGLGVPVAESPAPQSKVPAQLETGTSYEALRLSQLGVPKNTAVFRPTQADIDSAAFKVIVGEAKYTSSGLPMGTIVDVTQGGLREIKAGTSTLDSSYQLRLQVYYSVKNNLPYIIETVRPVNPRFLSWLERWGVEVEAPK